MTIVRRSIYTRCVLVALLLTLSAALAHGQQMPSAFVAGGKTAKTPSDPSTEEAHLRRLIETLEDPARRDELLASLRAPARRSGRPRDRGGCRARECVHGAADIAADGTEAVEDVALRIVDALERLALFVAWLESEWRDPSRRALWIAIGVSCLAAFGSGIVAHFLILRALAPIRGRLAIGATQGALARALRCRSA